MKINTANIKHHFVIIVSIILMLIGHYIFLIPNLSRSGVQVLCIFVGTLILWLNIAIDWPSVLLLVMLALVPELKFFTILASAYGSSTFVFLIFTFVLTYALAKTTYIKRIAMAFIHSKLATKGLWHFISLYFASILFIGLFISPTVLFFIYLPILEELYELLNLKKGDSLASVLMIGTVIMTGISSGMTPIAHVFPILAMNAYTNMYGKIIDYGSYIAIAVPIGLICAILTVFVLKYVLRPDISMIKKIQLPKMIILNKKIEKFEQITLFVFMIVIFMWILPSLASALFPIGYFHRLFKALQQFGIAFPPLLGVVVLCMITIDGKPILKLSEAMSKGVSWPSIMMCAGTAVLGNAITNTDIGLTFWISNYLQPITSILSPILMVLIFTLWAAIQTNFSSNMVTATVVSSAVLAVTLNMQNINVAAIIVNVGMMASYAFATPPAMPCVAVAVSSGWTNIRQMMIYGFIIMIISVIVATFIGYPLGTVLLS